MKTIYLLSVALFLMSCNSDDNTDFSKTAQGKYYVCKSTTLLWQGYTPEGQISINDSSTWVGYDYASDWTFNGANGQEENVCSNKYAKTHGENVQIEDCDVCYYTDKKPENALGF